LKGLKNGITKNKRLLETKLINNNIKASYYFLL